MSAISLLLFEKLSEIDPVLGLSGWVIQWVRRTWCGIVIFCRW